MFIRFIGPFSGRFIGGLAVLVACAATLATIAAPSAVADPDESPVTDSVAMQAPPEGAPLPPPVDDGSVVSPPPQTSTSPDGWTLTLGAEDETQLASAPLTTAVSSREYIVGGTFSGSLEGPDDGEATGGVLEVGYQIGCGIDMSTTNGVTLSGSAGVTSSLGVGGVDFISPLPDGLLPVVSVPVTGGVAVALKPGLINVVPVTKKEFEGTEPWVMISNFRVKIDGCVGQSFIRSYAFLTRSTAMSDAVLAYYGDTKVV